MVGPRSRSERCATDKGVGHCARGPAFLLLPNFRIILRYNTALVGRMSTAVLRVSVIG